MKFLLIFLVVMSASCVSQNKSSEDFNKKREQMVNDQIKGRGISDPRVLDAMTKVPRHLFVPEPFTGKAYEDMPLPIGLDQTISQPYIVALMTEVLRLKATDRVLEIGTGSGYQGWPEHAPFDAIIVTCAPARIPQPLKDQLAEEGRLINEKGKSY